MSKIDTRRLDTIRSANPNKSRKYLPALAAVGVLAVAGIAGLKGNSNDSSDKVPKVETPVATTIVGADTGGVWEAAENELIISGYADTNGSVPNAAVDELTDKSMKLNEAANPDFDSDNLQVGHPIIVVDMPDKSQG
jgi:hypothetical protein